MLKQTNLDEVKQVAKMLLNTDVKVNDEYENIVYHPFTNNPYISANGKILNILEDENVYAQFLQQWEDKIDPIKKFEQFLSCINKPYLLCFLKFSEPYISKEDCSIFLGEAWVRAETTNMDVDVSVAQLKQLFSKCDKEILMAESYTTYCELPSVVKIYRGVTEYNRKNKKALSWTINIKTAQYFATRFGEKGYVWEAEINKKDIYAYFGWRGESEVIVDYNRITNFKEMKYDKR